MRTGWAIIGTLVIGCGGECEQRGGACVSVSSSSGKCPKGSYNPFSADTYCPASFIGHCCVPEGDIGSPCDPTKACRVGACWPEAAHYPAGGVCGHACDADNCPSYGTCLTVVWSAAPSSVPGGVHRRLILPYRSVVSGALQDIGRRGDCLRLLGFG